MTTPGTTGGAGSGAADAQFVGNVPDLYERLLVPMIFEEPAAALADAVAALAPRDVLETAAGTGVLTRALHARVAGAALTATDLNAPMLAQAQLRSDLDAVVWQAADALDLPYGDAAYDVVACQFGVMFFPDKVRGYAEVARVLRPDGSFVFNIWDRIENNEISHVISQALVAAAPADPLEFLSRTPYGYFDLDELAAELDQAGLVVHSLEPADAVSRSTAEDAAVAFCQGTPLRGELDLHRTLDIDQGTTIAREALIAHYGPGPIAAPIRWFQVVATHR